jgi:hypothetical protein
VPYGILVFIILFVNSSNFFGERKEGVARLEFTKVISLKYLWRNMINNSSLQKWNRLSEKQLDTQFINEIISGLQCSPFEANAIVDSVYKIYAPYFQTNGSIKPGQILFQVLSIDNNPSVALSDSQQITVTLTFDDPAEDLDIREHHGVIGLRQHRIQRVCNEAYQQGGLLTVEDLACRLFNCGERTICRDLKALRNKNIVLPLRSTIKDMGRTISHRSLIVKHWLKGKEYSEISRDTFHSIQSVKNYIDKFKRVIALSEENYDVHTIAFLVKLSASLVEEYFNIFKNSNIAAHRRKELQSFLKKNIFYLTAQRGSIDK